MTGTIDREKLVTEILANRSEELLVVCGLGSSTYDVASIGDNSRNFYLWGAMGQAVPVGIGLAVAQPDKRVLVITGDGEMLMGLGALSAAGNAPVRNLAVLVLDNGHYSETGGQPTHTSGSTDIAGVAAQCGFEVTRAISDMDSVAEAKSALLNGDGPVIVVAKVALKIYGTIVEPQTRIGHYIAARFRMATTGRGEAALDR